MLDLEKVMHLPPCPIIKGLSVVDYCLVQIEYFSKFANFKVFSVLDIVQDHNLHSNGNLPDHSLCGIPSLRKRHLAMIPHLGAQHQGCLSVHYA